MATLHELSEPLRFKIKFYIQENHIGEAMDKITDDILKTIVSKLNLNNLDDIEQLAYIMWHEQEGMARIIDSLISFDSNDKKKRINLKYLLDCMLKDLPGVFSVRVNHLTPIGSISAILGKTNGCLDCIKFISQYTSVRDTYDKCLAILQALPKKFEGPIMNTDRIMYLMNYNPNFTTEQYVEKPCHLNKISDFRNSIYMPNPNQNALYDRYMNAFLKEMLTNPFPSESRFGSNDISIVVYIIRHFNQDYAYDKPSFQEKIKFHKINDDLAAKIYLVLDEIKSQNVPKKFMYDEAMLRVQEKLRFIWPEDVTEINDIFMHAYIYIEDDKNVNKLRFNDQVKYLSFINLFERKLVNPNSKCVFNLARNATEFGVFWIIKYLHDIGTNLHNLPKYSNHHCWLLEGMQLDEIIKLEIKTTNWEPIKKEEERAGIQAGRDKISALLKNIITEHLGAP